jgi:hypothetical protein
MRLGPISKFFLGVAMCVVGAYLIVRVFVYFVPLDTYDVRPFDRAAWAAGGADERKRMTRDALRQLRPGLHEADVVAMLGKTNDDEPAMQAPQLVSRGVKKTLAYYLGSNTSGPLESRFLWVHLDTEGKVVFAEIGGF